MSRKLDVIVNNSGAFICLAELSDKARQKARTMFTLKHETLPGIFDSRVCYKFMVSNNMLLIPRFAVDAYLSAIRFSGKHTVHNQITINTCKFDFECKLQLTPNQTLVLDHLKENYLKIKYVNANTSGIVIKMAAGQGKTYLAAGIIQHVKRRVMYVCDSSGLLHQSYQVFSELFGSDKVGKLYGKEKIYGEILICTIHSILSDAVNIKLKKYAWENGVRLGKPDIVEFKTVMELYEHYDMIIFDECQRYTSPEAYKIFKICQRPYMIGLSATPEDEIRGFHKILEWNIGPIWDVTELKGFSMDETNFTGIIKMIKYYGPEGYIEREINEITGLTAHDKIINKICEDPYRTALIIEFIYTLCDKKRNILVFAQTLEYLNNLEEMITNLSVYNIERVHQLRGSSTKEDFEDAKNNSKVILTTYQYFGVGKSFPHMDSIVFATPRKTGHIQFVNRIFRRGGDESVKRIIYDVVDWLTTLKSQWYKRKVKYEEIAEKQHKLTFKEYEYKYTDIDI